MHHSIISPVSCRCCNSSRNGMFVHGACTYKGELIKGRYQVSCTDCRAAGPLCESPEKALRGWELMMADKPEELIVEVREEILKRAV